MAKFFNKERMLLTVFKAAGVAVVLVLVVLWFLAGGIGKIITIADSLRFSSLAGFLSASSTDSFANFRLPWKIDSPQLGVEGVAEEGMQNPGDRADAPHAAFANPSPYAGRITVAPTAARTEAPGGQYLELDAAPGNPSALDVSGWMLESALTGARSVIPQAAERFTQGRINAVTDVTLAPGGRAILVTGPSPVGVSLRENECTGYLGTLQPFTPPLATNCPAPLSAVPRTQESDARLGAGCFDYLATVPPCTFPANPPSSLTSACRSQLQTSLSYNGCVAEYGNDPSFSNDSWRLYLAQGEPLWQGQHDVIRLLDRQGRVVDVVSY